MAIYDFKSVGSDNTLASRGEKQLLKCSEAQCKGVSSMPGPPTVIKSKKAGSLALQEKILRFEVGFGQSAQPLVAAHVKNERRASGARLVE